MGLLVLGCVLGGTLAGLLLAPIVHRALGGEDPTVVRWGMCTVTAAAFGAAAMWFGPTWSLPALLYLLAVGVALAVIDIRTHRLPDVLVMPSYPIGAVLLVLAVAGNGHWAALGWAVGGGVGLLLVFLAAATWGSAGFGDVKLAGLLGMYLGWAGGLGALLLGVFVAAGSAALVGIGLLLARRIQAGGYLSYGPFMLLGCGVGVALAAG